MEKNDKILVFSETNTKIFLNDKELTTATGFATYENMGLSTSDFAKTVPELHQCPLDSVKNAKAIVVLNIVFGNEITIEKNSTLKIIAANEYGQAVEKEISDVVCIMKNTVVNANNKNFEVLIEQYILVASDITPFKHIS